MEQFEVFAERERAGWSDSNRVDAYVAKFGPVTAEVAAELIARAPPEGAACLDLCCGQGELTARLLDAGGRVTGLDFSPAMLARAAAACPLAELREGDAAALPFEDDNFDLVFCNFGIMHLPDQPGALAEVARVLRPEGRFLLATWASPEISPAFRTVFGAIRAHADLSAAPPQPDLFAFADAAAAARMLADTGLEMTAHEFVTPAWSFPEPDGLFDTFLTGTVAASMLIRSQAAEVVARIRDDMTAAVASQFATDDGYRVPVPVVVVTAQAS